MQSFILLLICSAFGLGAAAHADLQAKYPFSAVLLDEGGQYYGLHWNFSRSTETIHFAVNVSTTGWVGFGLSPNGQMPGSDVVMGWVANTGETHFQDRYAQGRFLPTVDAESQDWFLTNSEEENGYTVLEFSRNFTSCDQQDLDITASTAHAVWSYSTNDPSNPTGSDATQHAYQGSQSVNFLGGTVSVDRDSLEGENFLDFTVTNVTIPPDSTTYWCETFRTPQDFGARSHYINRFGPAISPHARAYVHHIIVYECPSTLTDGDIGVSMPCHNLTESLRSCRLGTILGGWAVGGEDFIFPTGVAFPIDSVENAMIEMHYDNPNMDEGVVDSSGMRFYYTTETPEQRAGSLFFGHGVTQTMVIPPGVRNYTVTGICTAECTQQFPPEGIRIFANNFHTHLAGHGLTLQHFRYNEECGVLEELEPIDQNLGYDFNYQQTVILPKEHLVLPGDIVVLKCFYDTTDRTTVTFGGESTIEEMCVTFAYYYPKPINTNLGFCLSSPNPEVGFNQFHSTLLSVDPAAAQRFADPSQGLNSLNGLDWAGNPVLATSLAESVTSSVGHGFCSKLTGGFELTEAKPVTTGCSYQAPNRCSGYQPPSCCERINTNANTSSTITTATATEASAGATRLEFSLGAGLFLLLLSVVTAGI